MISPVGDSGEITGITPLGIGTRLSTSCRACYGKLRLEILLLLRLMQVRVLKAEGPVVAAAAQHRSAAEQQLVTMTSF